MPTSTGGFSDAEMESTAKQVPPPVPVPASGAAAVTDSADWLSRYAIASAETRATLECRLDLAYGAHAGERLDVFPAKNGPAPVGYDPSRSGERCDRQATDDSHRSDRSTG